VRIDIPPHHRSSVVWGYSINTTGYRKHVGLVTATTHHKDAVNHGGGQEEKWQGLGGSARH